MRLGAWLFPDLPGPELVAVGEAFDAEGVDELWLGDEGPAREPFTLLAALAVRTRTLRLGLGVTNPYTRPPAASALGMMTVDELSGGRALLGIGAGGQLSLTPFGLRAERPLATVAAAITMMRAVTAGSVVEGYDPPPGAFTRPALPIIVGAKGERLNRLASEVADGVFVAGIPLALIERVVGWSRSVRPTPLHLYLSVAIDPDDVEELRPRAVYGLIDAPSDTCSRLGVDREAVVAAAGALNEGDEGPARSIITDDVMAQLVLSGSPAEIARKAVAFARPLRPASLGVAVFAKEPARVAEHSLACCAALARELRI